MNKLGLLCLAIILVLNPCFAQKYIFQESYDVDSLRMILPDQLDEYRVNTLNKLGLSLSYQDYKLSMLYTEEALSLASEINYEEGMADAYRTYGHIYFSMGNYNQALNNYHG